MWAELLRRVFGSDLEQSRRCRCSRITALSPSPAILRYSALVAKSRIESLILWGMDLKNATISADPPPDLPAGSWEAVQDDRVAMDPHENLVFWPDPDAVAGWWPRQGSRFDAGGRSWAGQPIGIGVLLRALWLGGKRQRSGATFEFKLVDPAESLFEVRARSALQLAWLGSRAPQTRAHR